MGIFSKEGKRLRHTSAQQPNFSLKQSLEDHISNTTLKPGSCDHFVKNKITCLECLPGGAFRSRPHCLQISVIHF